MTYDFYFNICSEMIEKGKNKIEGTSDQIIGDYDIDYRYKSNKIKEKLETWNSFKEIISRFILLHNPSYISKSLKILENQDELPEYLYEYLGSSEIYDSYINHDEVLSLYSDSKNIFKEYIMEENLKNNNLKERKAKLHDLFLSENNDETISISFELKKPILTNGEESFYIHESPIAKEKIFKVPMVRPSSVKGKLRWVATRQFVEKILGDENDIENLEDALKERARLVRIFGDEKENIERYLDRQIASIEEDKNPKEIGKEFKHYLKEKGYYKERIESRRGRLQFYPIFFNDIGLEVITPIERDTGTADKPIQMEKIPAGTEGNLRLHYYPFDILGDEDKIKDQKDEDTRIIENALKDMLLKYGIGAKTVAGYGVATEESVENIDFEKVIINE